MEQKSMSDNISGMETQHKELGGHVKSLCNSLKNGCALSDLTGKLDKLIEFTDAHFVDEEKLMRLYGFDGLESHRRTHKLLSDSLAGLRENILDNFGEEEKKKLVAFLEGDFHDHIIEDMQAWERGEISKKFAYQRLHKHESSGQSGDMPAYATESGQIVLGVHIAD